MTYKVKLCSWVIWMLFNLVKYKQPRLHFQARIIALSRKISGPKNWIFVFFLFIENWKGLCMCWGYWCLTDYGLAAACLTLMSMVQWWWLISTVTHTNTDIITCHGNLSKIQSILETKWLVDVRCWYLRAVLGKRFLGSSSKSECNNKTERLVWLI